MDEEYDIIVLGTGLTECILSGLLSMEGKKVLHLDKNAHYGSECASLSLSKLFDHCKSSEKYSEKYGRDRDYNIDLIPKFLMANGELVEILVHTDVTRYLEFQQVAGSFVYKEGKGICKVPSTQYEAISSSLFGWFEKLSAKSFFHFLQNLDAKDPSTWQKLNLNAMTMIQVYDHFGIKSGGQDFIGHSLALHFDEEYLGRRALETCERIKLYMKSMLRFGKSPYIYPLYGLGELPQAFARLSAIYGGTYMLETPIDEIVYDAEGKVFGVKSQGKLARCKSIIADPSYVPERVKKTHRIIRVICLLDHPIPKTDNGDSCQIIIPQRQLGRKYDVYIAAISSAHQVCAKGYHVAIVSTIIETHEPEKEIEFALGILGPILEKFVTISDYLEPMDDGKASGLFVAKSADASSHFESVCDDVKDIYKRLTGESLKVKKRPTAEEEQASLSQSLGACDEQL